MAIAPTDVQKALKGVDYPAGREDLVRHAERNGADAEIVDALRGLDQDSFDGPTGVMEAMSGSLGGSD